MDTDLYQVLTGIFGGLALLLAVGMIWLLAARKSGHSQPAPKIRGGFSLQSLDRLLTTQS